MPTPITCPSCNFSGQARDDIAGQAIRCPKCKNKFRVPDLETTVAESSTPTPVQGQPTRRMTVTPSAAPAPADDNSDDFAVEMSMPPGASQPPPVIPVATLRARQLDAIDPVPEPWYYQTCQVSACVLGAYVMATLAWQTVRSLMMLVSTSSSQPAASSEFAVLGRQLAINFAVLQLITYVGLMLFTAAATGFVLVILDIGRQLRAARAAALRG